MNHFAFTGFKWVKKVSPLYYWLRKGSLEDCWTNSTCYFIVHTPLLKSLSVSSLIYFGIRSEVPSWGLSSCHKVCPICCTVVREALLVWMQTNCDDDYLVVSKDKLGIDLMDSLYICSLSIFILHRTVVKVQCADIHEVLRYVHGAYYWLNKCKFFVSFFSSFLLFVAIH